MDDVQIDPKLIECVIRGVTKGILDHQAEKSQYDGGNQMDLQKELEKLRKQNDALRQTAFNSTISHRTSLEARESSRKLPKEKKQSLDDILVPLVNQVLQDRRKGGYADVMETQLLKWNRTAIAPNIVLAKSGAFPYWPSVVVMGEEFDTLSEFVLLAHPAVEQLKKELEAKDPRVIDSTRLTVSKVVTNEFKNFVLVHYKFDGKRNLYNWCSIVNVIPFDGNYEYSIRKVHPNEKVQRVTPSLRKVINKVKESVSCEDTVLGKRLGEAHENEHS
jgi:hypothetical protein